MTNQDMQKPLEKSTQKSLKINVQLMSIPLFSGNNTSPEYSFSHWLFPAYSPLSVLFKEPTPC